MEEKMKHKILSAIMLVVLTSCMKIKKKDAETQQTAVAFETRNQNQAADSLTYEHVADKQIKKVKFLSPSNWPQSVILKRTDGEKVAEIPIEFDENSEWYDLLISENKVNYQFLTSLNNQIVLLDEVEVLPPLNLTINEDLNLAKYFSLNKKTKSIYFENLNIGLQKHLYLENFSGKIKIKNLISESGFIQSFSANARAENNFDGKDGGVIQIDIENGSGDVTVFMKGENGGHGSLAKSADNLIKGVSGERGASAKFSINFIPGSLFPFYDCAVPAGNGTDGGKGSTGYNGFSGKSGGHSGTATVRVHSDLLQVVLIAQEGVFGNGSPGGSGGEGGDPGPGSTCEEDFKTFTKGNPMIALAKRCEPSAAGKKGPTGDPGLPGGNGVNGIKQRSCLDFADKKVNCIHE